MEINILKSKMDCQFFLDGDIIRLRRDFGEPMHIFDLKASLICKYGCSESQAMVAVNKIFYGQIYSAKIEEQFEYMVGVNNEISYINEKESVELSKEDILDYNDLKNYKDILIFNQYRDIKLESMLIVKDNEQLKVNMFPNKKYDVIIIYFSFFCIRYTNSFFIAINEHLKPDGKLIIYDYLVTLEFIKEYLSNGYHMLLPKYFSPSFNPRFISSDMIIPTFDRYDEKLTENSIECISEFRKDSYVPSNIFTSSTTPSKYWIQYVNKDEKKGLKTNDVFMYENLICYVINPREPRSEKYGEMMHKIASLIEGFDVVSFNTYKIKDTTRWHSLYLELKRLASRLNKIKFIVISKSDVAKQIDSIHKDYRKSEKVERKPSGNTQSKQ